MAEAIVYLRHRKSEQFTKKQIVPINRRMNKKTLKDNKSRDAVPLNWRTDRRGNLESTRTCSAR
jgi:hypothetical protein